MPYSPHAESLGLLLWILFGYKLPENLDTTSQSRYNESVLKRWRLSLLILIHFRILTIWGRAFYSCTFSRYQSVFTPNPFSFYQFVLNCVRTYGDKAVCRNHPTQSCWGFYFVLFYSGNNFPETLDTTRKRGYNKGIVKR